MLGDLYFIFGIPFLNFPAFRCKLVLSIEVSIIVYSAPCFSPKITSLNPSVATEKGSPFTHGRVHSI